MKILHTADWHLGKKLEQFSRIEEQHAVMNEICGIAELEDVDVVLIAGDLFDTFNPSTDAVELFYKTLKRLSNDGQRLVIAIAGNHDSPERIEAPDPIARTCGIIFSGFPSTLIPKFQLDSGIEITRSEPGFIEVKLPRHNHPLRVILTPYANEYRLKTFLGHENSEDELRNILKKHWQNITDNYCDNLGVNILVSHLLIMPEGAEIPQEPEEEKPINHIGGAQAVFSSNIPSQIQYVALGHLHKPHMVDNTPCPIIYSGSPISYSFSEVEQDKFVYIIEAVPNEAVNYRQIPLNTGKMLVRHKAQGAEEAIEWLSKNPNILVELTLVTDHYLSAVDRKAILTSHDGIVSIIPEVKHQQIADEDRKTIDLNQNMDDLFKSYFKSKTGQDINPELIDLFQEIKAEKS